MVHAALDLKNLRWVEFDLGFDLVSGPAGARVPLASICSQTASSTLSHVW